MKTLKCKSYPCLPSTIAPTLLTDHMPNKTGHTTVQVVPLSWIVDFLPLS